MPETRAQLKARLKAVGMWEKYKEIKQQLQDDGVKPVDARVRALEQLFGSAEIPSDDDEAAGKPEREAGKPGPLDTPLNVNDFIKGKPRNLSETLNWVASHMFVIEVAPESAPSPQAYSLLAWARLNNSNQNEFWRSIYVRGLSGKNDDQGAKRFEDDGREIIGKCDKLLAISDEALEA